MGRYSVAVMFVLGACGVQSAGEEPSARLAPMPITSAEQTVTATGVTPAVASNGAVFLLVWSDGNDIYGSRIDPAGTILDTIAISTATGVQSQPQVASNGSDFLVTWTDGRNADTDIYAARVTGAGLVEEPNGLAIYSGAHVQDWPHIASNGTDYLVAWHDANGDNDDVYATRVSAAGVVEDGGGLAIAATTTREWYPSVGSLGGSYLVTWEEFRDHVQGDLYGRFVAANGTMSAAGGVLISGAPVQQLYAAIATNGAGYVVAWDDTRSTTSFDIYAAHVGSDGSVAEPDGLAISTQANHQLFPAMASNGFDYFLAWEDDRGNSKDIYGDLLSGSRVSAGDGFAIATDVVKEELAPTVAYQASAHGYLLAYQSDAAVVARFVRQCGDGVLQAGEACDDGNLAAGDGCSQICTVEPGFTCSGAPSSCADIDECATGNGGCAQTCTNSVGSFACGCTAGYALAADGVSCSDIDECATGNGGCAQSCTNSVGSYACACGAGYTLASDGHGCADIDECATDNGGCVQVCTNTAGAFACSCRSGYAGDGATCTDIDECATGNGGCSDICTNSDGGFACSCAPDQGLAADGVTCVTCGPGYQGDGTACADVDECALGTATCGEGSTCTNTDGSFTCAEPGGGCDASGGDGTGAALLVLLAALTGVRSPTRRRRPATA
ncbi:MAG: DUF4215 domain-containing protein [Kofleriaceae bacterium]